MYMQDIESMDLITCLRELRTARADALEQDFLVDCIEELCQRRAAQQS